LTDDTSNPERTNGLRLRPLHRQRGRRRPAQPVRNSRELAAALGCPHAELEAELQRKGIRYHKDSSGELWSSQPIPEQPSTQQPSTQQPSTQQPSTQQPSTQPPSPERAPPE
jgi:hypothetical protein